MPEKNLNRFSFASKCAACLLGLSVLPTANAESIAQFARSKAKAMGLLLDKDRSFVNVAGNFTLYEVEENATDPVLGLQLNLAPVSFFNVELGLGGNNNKVTAAAWNNFFSYAGAGIVYLFTTVAGSNKSFSSIHDKLTVDVRTDPPYKNSALWAGAYITPLPFFFAQPQFGVHFAKVSVQNKGDSLRSYSHTKVLPTIGIEARGENAYFGFRFHVDPETSTTIDPVTEKEVKTNKVSIGTYLGANF